MVFYPKDEEEKAMPRAPIIEEPTQATPTTQPISTAVEEEEDLAVPAEDLDRYFFSPSTGSASSPISKFGDYERAPRWDLPHGSCSVCSIAEVPLWEFQISRCFDGS